MTEEQIKMLRTLIQGEIEYALRNENSTDVFAFEQDKANDQGWEQFKESFSKEREYQPTPQTPEQVEEGLREAFRTAIKEGIIPEIKEPTDELIDKLVKNPPEFLKFELGKSLTDIIYRWWEDVFTTHSDWDMETSIEDLVDQIQMWLPSPQSAEGSQNVYVECTVEGWNDCLNKIKSKLR